ncbi:MAG: folate-binding protein YgfZ [Pseudomonadota bacterium]|nr:folate-binding protein YgfZ [Pseudomonadota bacterium]
MYSNWLSFVKSIECNTSSKASVIYLDHLGILSFSGSDSEKFLHNQLTCDIENLDSTQASPGGYLTAKGRLLCTFLIWRSGDEFLMQLPKALAQPTMARLKMFILRDKVNIQDRSEEMACYGTIDANDKLMAFTGLSRTPYARCKHDGFEVLNYIKNRALIIGDAEIFGKDLQLDPEKNNKNLMATLWRKIDIQDGWPNIMPETQDLFIPQMINLEKWGGVSFKKGCYPGQEIVARMQYRGMLKKTLHQIRLEPQGIIHSGDPIMHHDVSIGHIVNAEPDKNGSIALAVMQNDTERTNLTVNGYAIKHVNAVDTINIT